MNKNVLNKKLILTGLNKTTCLKDFKGKNLVLYFYPKDDTPGCTMEAKDFTRFHKKFQPLNTEILGVSRDSLESHKKFKNKYRYTFDFISDPEEYLCRAFGVLKEKTMFGKKVFGIERSTFVLSAQGRLLREWRKVKVPGHVEEVLKFIKSLAK